MRPHIQPEVVTTAGGGGGGGGGGHQVSQPIFYRKCQNFCWLPELEVQRDVKQNKSLKRNRLDGEFGSFQWEKKGESTAELM